MPKLKDRTLKTVLGILGAILIAVLSYTTNWNHPSAIQTPLIRETLPSATSTENQNLTLITEPDQGPAPLLTLIQSATSSIDLVMYQLTDKDISDALIAKTTQGVHVRVLLNKGYYGKQEDDTNVPAYEYLQKAGIPVRWTPATFALTHQKTVIFDNQKALIMTWNLVPKYYPTGREFGILDSDATDVKAIEDTFTADWNNTPIDTQYGTDLVWSPQSETDMMLIIQNAKQSLDIYNEEMADDTITKALEQAEKNGTKVRIVMTYTTTNKAVFNELTQAGVDIHTFASSKKNLYIHAKMILADKNIAFIGSENFSYTSLNKNRELGIFVQDANILASLEKTFNTDWANGKEYIVK